MRHGPTNYIKSEGSGRWGENLHTGVNKGDVVWPMQLEGRKTRHPASWILFMRLPGFGIPNSRMRAGRIDGQRPVG